MEREQLISIAKVCHQANKAWCESVGDTSQKDWDKAEPWQRDSAINGVKFRVDNPVAKQDAQHNSWMKEKVDAGWVYGEIKDAEAKTHPCIVPFSKLPEFQQKKDALFCSIVDALIPKRIDLTFGQRAVGLNFNPSGDDDIGQAKQKFADVIDQLNDMKSETENNEVKRLCSVAITESQCAQMWAVKAITWK